MLLRNAPRHKYFLKDGTEVPGVTTVLDDLNKPALSNWIFNGGVQEGIKYGRMNVLVKPSEEPLPRLAQWQAKQREGTADVGTIAHYKIRCWIKGETESFDPAFDPEQINMANPPYNAFRDYYLKRRAKWILSEQSFVHEKLAYGGTPDLLVETDRGVELWDIKTSKAIYPENYIQLAAYKMLVKLSFQSFDGKPRPIRCRVVLVTKEGKLEAPDVTPEYMKRARQVWVSLIEMHHRLKNFKKYYHREDPCTGIIAKHPLLEKRAAAGKHARVEAVGPVPGHDTLTVDELSKQ